MRALHSTRGEGEGSFKDISVVSFVDGARLKHRCRSLSRKLPPCLTLRKKPAACEIVYPAPTVPLAIFSPTPCAILAILPRPQMCLDYCTERGSASMATQ